MGLTFRKNWNLANPNYEDDALIIPMLNPDEDVIKVVLNEAYLNGDWENDKVQRLFATAARQGGVVSIRAGAHQIEHQNRGGFRLHIGAKFEGDNWHINVQQTNSGRMYVDSVSRGNPNGGNYYFEERKGAVTRY